MCVYSNLLCKLKRYGVCVTLVGAFRDTDSDAYLFGSIKRAGSSCLNQQSRVLLAPPKERGEVILSCQNLSLARREHLSQGVKPTELLHLAKP